jgi:hypothetical protein
MLPPASGVPGYWCRSRGDDRICYAAHVCSKRLAFAERQLPDAAGDEAMRNVKVRNRPYGIASALTRTSTSF